MTGAGALVRLIAILIVAAALPCRAEDAISGRWEGTARIPDDELTVIVDLAQENGAWVGSIIIPGLGCERRAAHGYQGATARCKFRSERRARDSIEFAASMRTTSWPAILSRREIAHWQRYRKRDRRRLSIRLGTRQWRRNSKANGKAITKCSVTPVMCRSSLRITRMARRRTL